MANILLTKHVKSTQIPALKIGNTQAYNFVKRCPEIKLKYIRKYDYQRAKCKDPEILQGWFDRVQATIQKYGIADQNIYNFDESGFIIGVISTAKVITGSERAGRPFFTQPGNREQVTVIEGINSAG